MPGSLSVASRDSWPPCLVGSNGPASTRRHRMAELYRGYAPSNVARDAKYSIRHDPDDGVMKVHLIYRASRRERALLSTGLHKRLVDMVNDVKIEVQGVAGGVFYI